MQRMLLKKHMLQNKHMTSVVEKMSQEASEDSTNLCLRFGEDFVVNMLVDFKQKTFSEIKINGEDFHCLSCLVREETTLEEDHSLFEDYNHPEESNFSDDRRDEAQVDWLNVDYAENAAAVEEEIVLAPPEAFSDTKDILLESTFESAEPVRITRIRKVKKEPLGINDPEDHPRVLPDSPQHHKSKPRAKTKPGEVIISKLKNICSYEGCTYRSKNLSDVMKHESTHTKTSQHECGECSKRFTQKCSLQRHISSVHLQYKKIRCNICRTAFRDNYTLKRHQIHSHPGK